VRLSTYVASWSMVIKASMLLIHSFMVLSMKEEQRQGSGRVKRSIYRYFYELYTHDCTLLLYLLSGFRRRFTHK
jgi:hypothetical protein